MRFAFFLSNAVVVGAGQSVPWLSVPWCQVSSVHSCAAVLANGQVAVDATVRNAVDRATGWIPPGFVAGVGRLTGARALKITASTHLLVIP